MSSTRDRRRPLAAAALLLLGGTAGCLKQTAPPAPVSHAPLVIDEAMQQYNHK